MDEPIVVEPATNPAPLIIITPEEAQNVAVAVRAQKNSSVKKDECGFADGRLLSVGRNQMSVLPESLEDPRVDACA